MSRGRGSGWAALCGWCLAVFAADFALGDPFVSPFYKDDVYAEKAQVRAGARERIADAAGRQRLPLKASR
jgi:hypothetical protein